MDIEQSGRVGPLLNELIEAIFPKKTDPAMLMKYKSYVARILSSRLSTGIAESEQAIVDTMRDQALDIAAAQAKNDNWGQKRGSRLQECVQRLLQTKTFRNRAAILKLLSSLATTRKDSSIKGPLFFQNWSKPIPETNKIQSNFDEPRRKEGMIAERSDTQMDSLRQGIVRELLFVFQGIESNCIRYQKETNSFELDPRLEFDKSEREMVLRLCEMGVLYNKIKEFLDKHIIQILGLVSHALAYAIREELNEYYRFITTLESMRDTGFQSGNGLSFKSIYLWTLEPMECLKWILVLCDICKQLKGGQILSALFSYTIHGCPEIQVLVTRLLTKSLSPFMRFLEFWIYKGELVDPMEEFFIQASKQKLESEKIWSDKYKLRSDLVPNFISRATAEEILKAGKTKHFLRTFIQGPQWHLTVEFINVENLISFKFMEGLKFRALENWVSTVTRECNSKLKDVIIKDYDFFEHCRMIKNFLLLGKGDFINALLEPMQEVLESAATKIFKHNLVSLLDSTKGQSSFSGYNKDYLDRVGIFLFDPSIGSRGWDIFSLNYEIEAPLNTIFDSESMRFYHEFFNLVWRIKNLISSLNNYSKTHRRHFLQQTLPEELLEKVKKCNFIRHQMLHFLNTFLSYVMLEVVETEWSTFLQVVRDAASFDDIIYSHREFIASVQSKVLLRDKANQLYVELVKLLGTIENFNKTQSVVFNNLEDKFQSDNASEYMDEEGSYDGRGEDHLGRAGDFTTERSRDLIKKNDRLILSLWKTFREGLDSFLEHLEKDQKLKTLSFRLDFNEFYRISRQLRREKAIKSPPLSRGLTKGRMDIEGRPPGKPGAED
jgi:gamma-tubulin complex component 3